MSQHERDLQHERELLEHYRQHSRGEPSAAVDARILAAAREAVVQPQPHWSQRLHAWLFGAGSRTRWSVAFAGLATLGIGLSLTWRTQEQLPAPYDMPAPVAAPAPAVAAEAGRSSAELARRKVEDAQKKAKARESLAESDTAPARQMAPATPAASAPAQGMADAADMAEPAQALAEQPAGDALHETLRSEEAKAARSANRHAQVRQRQESAPLEERLREVLRLRREGRLEEAQQLLALLRQAHPEEDLPALLRRLEGEPAASP